MSLYEIVGFVMSLCESVCISLCKLVGSYEFSVRLFEIVSLCRDVFVVCLFEFV